MKKYITKKEKGFVQIPNSILSDPNISLKAKTVLAIMLSLPDNWDFSIDGISNKCKESKDCIAKAINELIDAGYVKRTRTHGEDGRITKWDYEVFEEPCKTSEQRKEKLCEKNSEQVFQEQDNPSEDIPDKENKDIYNTIINKKENNNILYNNTQSNPIPSKNELRFDMSEIEKTRWIVKYNIDYDILAMKDSMSKDMLDEIVELMVETICSKNETVTIASNVYPHELLKSKFLKIYSEHVEYIINCVSHNKTKINNIKQYLLAAIFNAPNTIGSYYTTKMNHDLYG